MRKELEFIRNVALTVRELVILDEFRQQLEDLDGPDLQEVKKLNEEATVGAGMISMASVLTSFMGRGIDRFAASRVTGRSRRAVHLGARTLEVIGVLGFLSGTALIVSTLRGHNLVEMEQKKRER